MLAVQVKRTLSLSILRSWLWLHVIIEEINAEQTTFFIIGGLKGKDRGRQSSEVG
jgi:hypothetical protein